MQKKE